MEGQRPDWARHRGAALVVGMLLPVLGIVLFSATGRDDSHITFWAADALARSGSIVNYNGQLVEQSSSLLQTLLLAAVSVTGLLSTPVAALVLGALAGAATATMAWQLAEDLREGTGWVAGLLTTTSAYLVYWSLSGMETSLVALAAVAFALTGGRYIAGTGGPVPAMLTAAAWVLVRPEGVFVVLAALLGTLLLLRARPYTIRIASVAGTSLAIFAVVTVWRLLVYGLPFPQPVMAKVGGVGLVDGLVYVWQAVTPALLAIAAAGAVGAWAGLRKPSTALAAGVVAAQLGFVVASGGDWMEGGRMVVPLLGVLCALAAVGFRHVRATAALTALTLVLNLGGVLWFARYHSTGQPVWAAPAAGAPWTWPERVNRVHARDALFLPEFAATLAKLDAGLDRSVVYASAQAGMVPYYVFANTDADVRFVDRWSLSTRRTAACNEHAKKPSVYGRELTYRAWAAADGDCGRLPDIVVELGTDEDVPAGYTQIFRQPAPAVADIRVLPGRRVRAEEFVAVRDEHLPLLDAD